MTHPIRTVSVLPDASASTLNEVYRLHVDGVRDEHYLTRVTAAGGWEWIRIDFSGGEQDETAFVEGTGEFVPIGGVFNDAFASDPAAGQQAVARITSDRALHVNLRGSTGTELGTAGNPVRTNPTGSTAQPVTDNGGNLSVDDGGGSLTVDGSVTVSGTATVSGTVAVSNFPATYPVTDNGGSLTVDGSVSLAAAIPAGTNNIGDVDVLTLPALPAGTNNIGDVDVLTLPALPAGNNNIGDVDIISHIPGTAATQLGKAEDVAAANNDTGVFALAVRRDTAASGVDADGDYASLNVDSTGHLWARIGQALPAGTNTIGRVGGLNSFNAFQNPAVNTQATVTQAAGGGSVRNIATCLTVTLANDAAAGAICTFVLRDGATGAGTVLWVAKLAVPAVAFNNQVVVVPCWIQGSANTAMTLESTAAPGANLYATVSLQGVAL